MFKIVCGRFILTFFLSILLFTIIFVIDLSSLAQFIWSIVIYYYVYYNKIEKLPVDITQ